ncbi:MAG: hypothetical protein ACM3VT_08205 [Solirubrobacterales bacterium]
MVRITPRPGGSRFGFWTSVIWICFGFGSSCFGFDFASSSPLLIASAWGQSTSGDDGFGPISDEQRANPIDQINEALKRYGRYFLWVGVGLSAVVAIKIVAPVQIYYSLQDRRLQRAVRAVDELLKRIQKEAETTNGEAPKQETKADAGILAGMAEMAEFEQTEQVPSYVLTVNDMMLDNIAVTLKRLRRFGDGSAEKYQDYMFAVIQGIKTITEQSAESHAPSGLAVDVSEYFRDELRCKMWRKALSHWARKGKYQETAAGFLSFIRKVREGRPMTALKPNGLSLGDTAVTAAIKEPAVPEVLSEETLPVVQKAAVEEAQNFRALIETGVSPQKTESWQFELVRRQQQVHLREDAQHMLSVFLKHERKALREITKIRMLPCRTWGHVLYLLGVENTAHLRARAEAHLLTTQEILILEKTFLQTFAKRESLVRIYGQGEKAVLMMDSHVPEIRQEALGLLHLLQQTQPDRLDDATEILNEEETPQNGLVKKLIAHYKK